MMSSMDETNDAAVYVNGTMMIASESTAPLIGAAVIGGVLLAATIASIIIIFFKRKPLEKAPSDSQYSDLESSPNITGADKEHTVTEKTLSKKSVPTKASTHLHDQSDGEVLYDDPDDVLMKAKTLSSLVNDSIGDATGNAAARDAVTDAAKDADRNASSREPENPALTIYALPDLTAKLRDAPNKQCTGREENMLAKPDVVKKTKSKGHKTKAVEGRQDSEFPSDSNQTTTDSKTAITTKLTQTNAKPQPSTRPTKASKPTKAKKTSAPKREKSSGGGGVTKPAHSGEEYYMAQLKKPDERTIYAVVTGVSAQRQPDPDAGTEYFGVTFSNTPIKDTDSD